MAAKISPDLLALKELIAASLHSKSGFDASPESQSCISIAKYLT